MALETNFFGQIIDSRSERMQYDEEFSFVIQRVKGYYGREIPYGSFVDELVRGEYLTKEELQLFLELCISRRWVQQRPYIESLCQRITDAKDTSPCIRGHKTIALTPFGRKASAHSRERGDRRKKRRAHSSDPLEDDPHLEKESPLENLLEKAIHDTRANPPSFLVQAPPLDPPLEKNPCLCIPEQDKSSCLEMTSSLEEWSLCGGKGICPCICHQLGGFCRTCTTMQNDAKAFLAKNPSSQEKKRRLVLIQTERKTMFSEKKKTPKRRKKN